jgi:hypothetical protein
MKINFHLYFHFSPLRKYEVDVGIWQVGSCIRDLLGESNRPCLGEVPRRKRKMMRGAQGKIYFNLFLFNFGSQMYFY